MFSIFSFYSTARLFIPNLRVTIDNRRLAILYHTLLPLLHGANRHIDATADTNTISFGFTRICTFYALEIGVCASGRRRAVVVGGGGDSGCVEETVYGR